MGRISCVRAQWSGRLEPEGHPVSSMPSGLMATRTMSPRGKREQKVLLVGTDGDAQHIRDGRYQEAVQRLPEEAREEEIRLESPDAFALFARDEEEQRSKYRTGIFANLRLRNAYRRRMIGRGADRYPASEGDVAAEGARTSGSGITAQSGPALS